jgi:hypothetical protein
LAGGRKRQHLNLARVVGEAGRGHESQSAASHMRSRPAKA